MTTKWGTGGRTLQVGEQGIREGSLRQMKKTVSWFYKKIFRCLPIKAITKQPQGSAITDRSKFLFSKL